MGSSQSSLALTVAVLGGGALAASYVHRSRSAPQKPANAASAPAPAPASAPSSAPAPASVTKAEPGAGASTAVKKKSSSNKRKKQASALSDDASSAPAVAALSPPAIVYPVSVPGAFESAPSTPAPAPPAPLKGKKTKKRKKGSKKDADASTARPGDADDESKPAGQASGTDSESEASEVPPSAPPALLAPKAKPKAARPQPRISPPLVAAAAEPVDERWTRVESRRKVRSERPVTADSTASTGAGGDKPATGDVGTSDAGVTTSVTGNSSPVTDRTTEDEFLRSAIDETSATPVPAQLPPGEAPATGFSLDDYEGVQVENDVSGEDDGGWGVVRSKGRSKLTSGSGSQAQPGRSSIAPESMTKKQRQNAAKRDAQKQAKLDAEAERLAVLAKHKRELERAKMAEQFGSGKGASKA